MATLKDFAVSLLNTLGLDPTKNRIMSIVAFGAIEGGHWNKPQLGTFNPMNTMLSASGARDQHDVDPQSPRGIKRYPDWNTGIKATAATIVQTNMRPIAVALKNDADPRAFLQAVTQSKWCPGCDYTPYDPTALYLSHANVQDSEGSAVPTVATSTDFLTKYGPWLLAFAGLAAIGGLYYVSTKPGGIKGFLGVGASESRRRARSNPLKRGSSRATISANIRKLHREHPNWAHNRVVAAALNNARRTSRGALPPYLH